MSTDLDKIFIEVYKAFPANIKGRDEIEATNYIILPPSALKKLPQDIENFFFSYSKYSTEYLYSW